MKYFLLLSLTALSLSIDARHTMSTPSKTGLPVTTELADLLKSIAEDARYDSRHIDVSQTFSLSKPANKYGFQAELFCNANWGYKGAGNKNEPFTGFAIKPGCKISFDGLTLDIMRSRAFQENYGSVLAQISHATPLQEFVLKVGLLFLSGARDGETYPLEVLTRELDTLVERLKITPGNEAILKHPSFEPLFTIYRFHPQTIALLLLSHTQHILRSFGMLTSPLSDVYYTFLFEFFHAAHTESETIGVTLPGEPHRAVLSFGYAGLGDQHAPIPAATITVDRSTAHVSDREIYTLSPEVAALLKCVVIMIDAVKSGMPQHNTALALDAIVLRLALTPNLAYPNFLTVLSGIASFHKKIVHFNMEKASQRALSYDEFLVYLGSIFYYGTLLKRMPHETESSATQATERATYFSEQCGHALRQYLLTNFADDNLRALLMGDTKKSSGFNVKAFVKALCTMPVAPTENDVQNNSVQIA